MNGTTVKNLRNISIRFFPLIIEFNIGKVVLITHALSRMSAPANLLIIRKFRAKKHKKFHKI